MLLQTLRTRDFDELAGAFPILPRRAFASAVGARTTSFSA
jgi:hypothetical protein